MKDFIFIVVALKLSGASKDYQKYREISAIVKTVGQIPCPINSLEDVSMILWFKDSSGSPIYSYDARNEKEPRHLTLNDWGLRLYFRVWPSSKRSPALMIRQLEPTDAGYYRCRVDYKNSPTANSITRLKIIEPPTSLQVQDISQFRLMSDQMDLQHQKMMPAGSGSELGPINPNLNDITYMGPYLEGQSSVTIVCTAYGGNPPPQVLWLWYDKGREMMDSSYEMTEGNYVTNELKIVNLTRETHDLYTCQASNDNDTKITHRVNLDIYLTPKHIQLDFLDTMIAKETYKLTCQTIGAYPTIEIQFSKVQKSIGAKYQIKSDADNVTTYTITFQPEIEDDEEIIYCRAENPWIVGKQIEARKKLHVYYPPVVVIRFGSSKTTNFSEGESVLLECHVKSNPILKKISWYHEENYLKEDTANGLIIKGFTLLLRQLVFASAGDYRCEAHNAYGKGSSDNLKIIVNISPRCADDSDSNSNGGRGKIIPLSLGQTHRLHCKIQAWPSDLSFYWTLQRSREIVAIPSTGNLNIGKIFKQLISSTVLPFPSDNSSVSWLDEFTNVNMTDSNEMDMENNSSINNFNLQVISESETDDNNENEDGQEFKLSVRTKRDLISEFFGSTETETDQIKINQFLHETFLPYEIYNEDSYGTVACWAKNSFGQQLRPCYFHIVTPQQADGGQAVDAMVIEEKQGEMNLGNSSQSTGKTENKLKEGEYHHETYDKKEKVKNGGNEEEKVQEEVRPLSSKLRGTLGITIILIGVLIFIGCFTGAASWLLLSSRKRKNSEQSGGTGATATCTNTLTLTPQTTSPPTPLSPSIHNGREGICAKLPTGLSPPITIDIS